MPDATEYPERRKNSLLRLLINEMMQQIREMQAHDGPWPEDERAKVEGDLERIMLQVRGAAVRKEGA